MLLVVASGLFFTLMMMAYKRQLKLQAKAIKVEKEQQLRQQQIRRQQRPY